LFLEKLLQENNKLVIISSEEDGNRGHNSKIVIFLVACSKKMKTKREKKYTLKEHIFIFFILFLYNELLYQNYISKLILHFNDLKLTFWKVFLSFFELYHCCSSK